MHQHCEEARLGPVFHIGDFFDSRPVVANMQDATSGRSGMMKMHVAAFSVYKRLSGNVIIVCISQLKYKRVFPE
mgnify:CR=1 FL=1